MHHPTLRRAKQNTPTNGSSDQSMGYNISLIADAEKCFDSIGWCETDLLDILAGALEEHDLEEQDFILLLNGLQAYFCDGAMGAFANTTAFIHGSGEFTVNRAGNNGAVKQISLDAGLDTTVLALAHVDINEGAEETASAQAYAYRRVGSTGVNSCGTRYVTGSLRYWLCATAKGDVSSDVEASATVTGSGTAVGGTDLSTDVSVSVTAANIQEFSATVSTSASSFAAAEASVAAEAYASAYASALVDVQSQASTQERRYTSCLYRRWETYCHRHCSFCPYHCHRHLVCVPGYYWYTISSTVFRDLVDEVKSEVEESFATSFASSLAMIHVTMTIPAYFKNEKGKDDTLMFPEGVEEIPVEITSQCVATAV